LLGYFNPILGQIWTTPNVRLKVCLFNKVTHGWVCPHLTQIWFETLKGIYAVPNATHGWVCPHLTHIWYETLKCMLSVHNQTMSN